MTHAVEQHVAGVQVVVHGPAGVHVGQGLAYPEEDGQQRARAPPCALARHIPEAALRPPHHQQQARGRGTCHQEWIKVLIKVAAGLVGCMLSAYTLAVVEGPCDEVGGAAVEGGQAELVEQDQLPRSQHSM